VARYGRERLLFYEDPDYGFVFNATVRQPHVVTNVHDHGNVWTLYGLIEGRETMYRYERIDDGPADEGPAQLKLVGQHVIGPGDIDIVPPGKIHQEHAGPERSIAFIVRARRPGTFPQHYYDLVSGAVAVNHGPQQVVHALA
jgi:predicted metal-dependent enzyme (double-stranded beta helix superfamily)